LVVALLVQSSPVLGVVGIEPELDEFFAAVRVVVGYCCLPHLA